MRPAPVVTLAVLALMAFVNGWRSMVASALGMDAAPEDKVAVMSMRAAANQFGYLLRRGRGRARARPRAASRSSASRSQAMFGAAIAVAGGVAPAARAARLVPNLRG